MSGQGALILAVGMMTSIGIGATQTAASVRAGISRFKETSIYDKRFQPFVMATIPDDQLPPIESSLETVVGLTSRQARMLRLAAPAIQEVLGGIQNPEQIPVFIGTPEPLAGRPDPAGVSFLEHLSVQSNIKFNIKQSRMFPTGRASGILALREGLEYLKAGKSRLVIVGGVDTYLDLYLLGTLDMEERILAQGVMDGFVPGEGAGFMLLGAPEQMKQTDLKGIARIGAVGNGCEKGHRYSQEVYRGDGLAEAFQALFASAPASCGKIRTVFAGLNGENYGAKEWGVAYMRSKERFEEDFKLQHPVDCFGDTGAALGPLMICLAAIGIHKGYVNAPCLVWCSSDREDRAAAIIQGLSN